MLLNWNNAVAAGARNVNKELVTVEAFLLVAAQLITGRIVRMYYSILCSTCGSTTGVLI